MRPAAIVRALALCAALLLPGIAAADPAPFLWTLRHDGVTHHLQGSVHLLPADAYPLSPALERAYARAADVVFEADPGQLTEPQTQRRLLQAASAGDGGLRARLPAPLYARLQAGARRLGMPLQLCEPFKAWYCALSLEIFIYQQAGFRPETGLDAHFHARALEDGKAVAGLESVDAHLALFTAMPRDLGVELLSQALDAVDGESPTPQELYAAWRRGDADRLAELLARMRERHPRIHERVLAARNRAWLPELQRRLTGSRPQLVLVGAAHFVGPDGLVALLAEQGLQLQPAR